MSNAVRTSGVEPDKATPTSARADALRDAVRHVLRCQEHLVLARYRLARTVSTSDHITARLESAHGDALRALCVVIASIADEERRSQRPPEHALVRVKTEVAAAMPSDARPQSRQFVEQMAVRCAIDTYFGPET